MDTKGCTNWKKSKNLMIGLCHCIFSLICKTEFLDPESTTKKTQQSELDDVSHVVKTDDNVVMDMTSLFLMTKTNLPEDSITCGSGTPHRNMKVLRYF